MNAVLVHLIPITALGLTVPAIAHVVPADDYYTVPRTLTGIVCGHCSNFYRDAEGTRHLHRHADVAAVRRCFGYEQEMQAEAKAEAALARAEADYWDNGGPHREAIAAEADYDRMRAIYDPQAG